MIIYRNGMAWRGNLFEIRMLYLCKSKCFDVGRPLPLASQLARHDFTLQFCPRPNASQGLKQANEVNTWYLRMKHLKV